MKNFAGILICTFVMPALLTSNSLAQSSPTQDAARAGGIRLLPPTATVGMTGRPAAMVNSDKLRSVERAGLSNLLRHLLRIDVANLNVVAGAMDFNSFDSPGIGFALSLKKATSPGQMAKDLRLRGRPTKLDGKPYLFARPESMNLLVINPKTLILGSDAVVRAMKDRSGTPTSSDVHKLLTAGKASDLHLAMDTARNREMLDFAIARLPPLPEEAGIIKKLPEMATAIEVRINTTDQLSFELTIHATDEATAGELASAISEGIALLGALKPMAVALKGPHEKETIETLFDISLASLQTKTVGSTVVIGGPITDESAFLPALAAYVQTTLELRTDQENRMQARNGIRAIVMAFLMHESATQRFPAHALYNDAGEPLLSWRVAILPFLGEEALYKKFKLDEPWDSPHNKKLIPLIPNTFQTGAARGLTHLQAVIDPQHLFSGKPEGRRISEIRDGTSRTIAVLESSKPVPWTKPEDHTLDPQDPTRGLGHSTSGQVVVGRCDGSTVAIPIAQLKETLKGMLTIAGGER